MDVLAMMQPHNFSHWPLPDQLRPVARKLLDKSPTRYRVTREDLSTLFSLLLRLRLYEAKWSLHYHRGTFDEADPSDRELAAMLVNGLGTGQDEKDLTSEQVLRVIDLLVSKLSTRHT